VRVYAGRFVYTDAKPVKEIECRFGKVVITSSDDTLPSISCSRGAVLGCFPIESIAEKIRYETKKSFQVDYSWGKLFVVVITPKQKRVYLRQLKDGKQVHVFSAVYTEELERLLRELAQYWNAGLEFVRSVKVLLGDCSEEGE